MKKVAAWIFVIAFLGGLGLTSQAMAAAPAIDIWTAASKGNIDAIRQHVITGTDINETFIEFGTPGSGGSPLHVAVLAGQMEATKLLIEKGANINARGDDEHGGPPLHWAAAIGRMDFAQVLVEAGADVNAKENNGYTPLDATSHAAIADLLRQHGGETKSGLIPTVATSLRGVYSVNGELHINTFGTPEGKPITSGHHDMKGSWSREGGKIVFFRVTRFAPAVPNWKTAICVVNADGTGFRKLTDGTHTDFNPTWTRDGTEKAVLNRRDPKRGTFAIYMTTADANPGDEFVVSDTHLARTPTRV